jgi:hypothetical protein
MKFQSNLRVIGNLKKEQMKDTRGEKMIGSLSITMDEC